MKTTPKHIKAKVERINRLMEQIVELNMEVEDWLEKNGIENGFDFTDDFRDSRGYGIDSAETFYARIEEFIN